MLIKLKAPALKFLTMDFCMVLYLRKILGHSFSLLLHHLHLCILPLVMGWLIICVKYGQCGKTCACISKSQRFYWLLEISHDLRTYMVGTYFFFASNQITVLSVSDTPVLCDKRKEIICPHHFKELPVFILWMTKCQSGMVTLL